MTRDQIFAAQQRIVLHSLGLSRTLRQQLTSLTESLRLARAESATLRQQLGLARTALTRSLDSLERRSRLRATLRTQLARSRARSESLDGSLSEAQRSAAAARARHRFELVLVGLGAAGAGALTVLVLWLIGVL